MKTRIMLMLSVSLAAMSLTACTTTSKISGQTYVGKSKPVSGLSGSYCDYKDRYGRPYMTPC